METAAIEEATPLIYVGESMRMNVSFHKSGVGILLSAFSLSRIIAEHQPDLLIQVGMAGSFDESIPLGSVVAVKNEYMGDVGAEENGEFLDVFDLKLEHANEFPFEKKKLCNHWLEKINLLKLKEVSGVTVNEVTTRPQRKQELQKKYLPLIESMEGAALHYAGIITGTPFIQVRAVSNYIGERDKSKWRMKLALDNLTHTVLNYFDALYNIE